MKPRYSSNSQIFEQRGDPWVSEKEGIRDYGRDLFSENPDFDRYFTERHPEADRGAFARASADLRKGLAELPEERSVSSAPKGSQKGRTDLQLGVSQSVKRRLATRLCEMNQKLLKLEGRK